MRIALIHDYLSQDGGAERVLKAFHEIWPTAPIFLLFHNKNKITGFDPAVIKESFLGRMPFINAHFQWYLPWMPLAIEKFNLTEFEVVLSTSSTFAKGVITSPHTLHICYCHTPPRFLWADSHDYLGDLHSNRFVKIVLPALISRLRLWDKMSTDRVDHFIANSKTVQHRIQKYYRRDSEVMYPPVDTKLFAAPAALSNYYVTGGRLVPYKRIDLVISAFNRLRSPLFVFGTGPELPRLKRMAKPHITFLERISEEQKASLFGGARAFIHPQIEDSGITPLESMASGRPVIALAQGGATETVVERETGLFFHHQTWESLLHTMLHFDHTAWDSNKIREHAAQYNIVIFKDNIKKYVEHRYEEFQRGVRQGALWS